jgi:transcription-repair coupling factor (superfamily II helicase)
MRKIGEKKNFPGDPEFRSLFERIGQGETKIRVGGLKGSARALFLSLLFRKQRRTVIVVTPGEKDAETLSGDISFFLGADQVLLYPPWDIRSADVLAFQRDVYLARTDVLYRLMTGRAAVVVLSLEALIQKVVSRAVFADYVATISVGDTLERDGFVEKLLAGGFSRASLVEGKGEFAVRGHIIDIFPPAEEMPLRMEFVGDELESIRRFDPASQRSTVELAEFVLSPAAEIILLPDRRQRAVRNIRHRANELELPALIRNRLTEMVGNGSLSPVNPRYLPLFYESLERDVDDPDEREAPGTFFDYAPADSLLVLDDPLALRRADEEMRNEIDRFLLKAANAGTFYLERETSFLSDFRADFPAEEKIFGEGGHGDNLQQIYLETLALGIESGEAASSLGGPFVKLAAAEDFRPAAIGHPLEGGEEGMLAPLAESIRGWLRDGYLVVFLCTGRQEVQRVGHLLERYALPLKRPEDSRALVTEVEQSRDRGELLLLEGKLSGGFHLPALKTVVITDEEIFGRKIHRRRTRPAREGYFLQSFGELKEADYAVHTEHGIGLYRGLKKLAVGGIENDFLLLEYQDGDKLYLPVDRLDQIQRYIGPEGYLPRVDKLGGTSWEAAKEKVKRSVREVAEELASIYAIRKVMERRSFPLPDNVYDEFCAAFEFEETPDQAKAIEDIHLDMSDVKPMDRLICGDAGFGKTEVALRASFRAAMDGKQVAVLVPTTILAEQHYQTFSRRLENYPFRVEVLNRFRTRAEVQKILEGLAAGTVDIVIGTHRLLQKDVTFRDLGLVIIDEEQRFGVSHKEKLKKLRTLVDCLTLTATPIPRTLHLSLVGVRDLSIINTPPEDRQPIRTHVLEFNEEVIREAILRELKRDGRVFFLHDRVRSIFSVARMLERLVPEAKIGVVHGRMKPGDIEEGMAKFIRGEYNVLVCTTIIGSGLDIPTANTIIINRADRFGLAQLYQIRGRVGRSREEAAAYLMIPKGVMLSRDAQKRLQVIMDFSEPGSGFRIASNDLEIRGGGNILGTSQSGHISAVGYELYTELMEKTIREMKGEKMPEEEIRPEINLGLPAFIPEDYMPDVQRRLVAYKRISLAATDEELAAITDEMKDCYGFVPPEMENLFGVISVRNLLKVIRGKKMGYDRKTMFIVLRPDSTLEPEKIMRLARSGRKDVKLTPDFKLTVSLPGLKPDEIVSQAKELLHALMN